MLFFRSSIPCTGFPSRFFDNCWFIFCLRVTSLPSLSPNVNCLYKFQLKISSGFCCPTCSPSNGLMRWCWSFFCVHLMSLIFSPSSCSASPCYRPPNYGSISKLIILYLLSSNPRLWIDFQHLWDQITCRLGEEKLSFWVVSIVDFFVQLLVSSSFEWENSS